MCNDFHDRKTLKKAFHMNDDDDNNGTIMF